MKDLAYEAFCLDDQFKLEHYIGYRLRLAMQRHCEIFTRRMADVTTTQFALLVKLLECGPTSQNLLGRLVSVDQATVKGIVDRLEGKGYVERRRSEVDQRKINVWLTSEGEDLVRCKIPDAEQVAFETMSRLTDIERDRLLGLLGKL
jgi:DNA-binding MarR family transcriptional regulator